MEFEGLTAIVTGGSSGIGLATALTLAHRGARVAVLDLVTETAPSPLVAIRCDVADDDSVRAAVATAAEALGGIDIVINNAGVGAQGTVESNPDDEWSRVFDINVLGIARVTRAAMPFLRRSKNAAVVNTCSVVAFIGMPERALYSASKGAVFSLTLAMAADHLREGVRINCVSPGTADTPWVGRLLATAENPEMERAALASRQPSGRLVTPEEVAAAVAYLASPLAGSTTGTNMTVDGGLQGLRLRQAD